MRRRFLVAVFLSTLPLLPSALVAQSRELHWRQLDVDARLDADGALHVRERHEMVFTGDWNGGERRFSVRAGQSIHLTRITRIGPAPGDSVVLEEGALDRVDRWSWFEGETVRWRSRLPSDPPFDATTITYALEYSLGHVVVATDSSYELRHDFGFADRAGVIEHIRVHLAVDPGWEVLGRRSLDFSGEDLLPGEGFVQAVTLRYRGSGSPTGVDRGAAPATRRAIAGALLLLLVALGVRFVARERRLGRFAPLTPLGAIDEAWLREHVFSMLPEEAGTVWDDTTSAPEVAAIIARLVQEKKLETEVRTIGSGWLKRESLDLRLLVDRDSLRGHERALISALFSEFSDRTSTEEVRTRYRSTGFDPASVIRGTLKIRLTNLPGGTSIASPSKLPTLVLLLAAVALMVIGGARRLSDAGFAAASSSIVLAVYLFSLSQAAVWRSRVWRAGPHMLRFALPFAALSSEFGAIASEGRFRPGAFALGGLALLIVALWNSVLNMAMSRDAEERIALRKRLTAARNWFREELRKPTPQLRDEWFPYFVAFGLGGMVEKWFRAFGGSAPNTRIHSHAIGHSSGSSSSSTFGSSPGYSGFGGGGGFAGGGSSSSWTSAVSTFSAGVSAPSSSSSGGSSGSSSGGSSSGGGGGGGW